MQHVGEIKRRVLSSRASPMVVGTMVGQGALVLGSPGLARVFGAEALGVYFVYFSIASFAGLASSLRYDLALPLVDAECLRAMMRLCAVLVLTVLCVGGVLVFGVMGATGLWSGGIPGSLGTAGAALAGVGLGGEAAKTLGRVANVREGLFRRVGFNVGTAGCARVGAQLLLGIALTPSPGLLIGVDAVVRVLAALHLWRGSYPSWGSGSWSTMWGLAVRYRRFAGISAPATVVSMLARESPLWVIAWVYGAQESGWFGMVLRVGGVPTVVMGRALMDVYHSEAALAVRNGDGLRTPFRRTLKRSCAMALGLAPLFVVGSWGLPIVLGPGWEPVRLLLLLYLPAVLLQFVSVTVDPTLPLLERQGLHLIREVGRGVLVLAWVGVLVALEPGLGAGVLMLSFTVASGFAIYIAIAYGSVARSGTR